MGKEYLTDIEGSEHLELERGERYRGWYLKKTSLRVEVLPLGFGNLTYNFQVCDYRFRFIMPPKTEFIDGILSYSQAERLFGVFRFPQDENGHFCTPVPLNKIEDKVLSLTQEEINALMSRKGVLTFEAFRIPSYGFEYFFFENHNFNEIAEITNEAFCKEFQESYRIVLESKSSEVLKKISDGCNYLLILDSVLNLRWKNLSEVAVATNNIIHI